MKDLLKEFEQKAPQIVFEWHDSETEAEGWVVINSLRNGAAGGGTRMRKGLDRREVESLAKTMEIKFTISGPVIGGAKSGINFDPSDPRKEEVLRRWYRAVFPLLKSYYGTGGDLNVDEVHEVIPITQDIGLWHPQEGIVNGHFQGNEAERIQRIGNLRQGVSKVLEDPEYNPETGKKYTVADMITGYGVAESVRHYLSLAGESLQDKRILIQGWGNVGSAAALYLAKEGGKIGGIIDREGGIVAKDGLDLEQVKKLFHNKKGNTLVSDHMIPFDELNKTIWKQPFDIFIPAAASRLVSRQQAEDLINAGTQIIASGANVPFQDSEIFYGPIAEYVDQQITLIPDFIANCGMARVFAFLMENKEELTDQAIFSDVSKTIFSAVESVMKEKKTNSRFTESAFTVSLKNIL